MLLKSYLQFTFNGLSPGHAPTFTRISIQMKQPANNQKNYRKYAWTRFTYRGLAPRDTNERCSPQKQLAFHVFDDTMPWLTPFITWTLQARTEKQITGMSRCSAKNSIILLKKKIRQTMQKVLSHIILFFFHSPLIYSTLNWGRANKILYSLKVYIDCRKNLLHKLLVITKRKRIFSNLNSELKNCWHQLPIYALF